MKITGLLEESYYTSLDSIIVRIENTNSNQIHTTDLGKTF